MARGAGCVFSDSANALVSRNIKFHSVKTFKLSNNSRFEEKFIDVAGLYLNSPKNSVDLCMDEKSRIQALDHTRASFPINSTESRR